MWRAGKSQRANWDSDLSRFSAVFLGVEVEARGESSQMKSVANSMFGRIDPTSFKAGGPKLGPKSYLFAHTPRQRISPLRSHASSADLTPSLTRLASGSHPFAHTPRQRISPRIKTQGSTIPDWPKFACFFVRFGFWKRRKLFLIYF